ncbi:S8 family serine peptidase [Desulfoluna sp.]|uniref:S8 family serine peptidase n=1 Tax=Desulfoluna sp. TaxID=2045199 RepID=UPI00260B4B9E|nr:S8 family serine peptidase [Desulfoluna sp.]
MKKRHYHKLTLAACALYLSLTAAPLHASDTNSGIYTGEDNIASPLTVSRDDKTPYEGRVAPQVLAESKTRDHINVIIFLKSKDLTSISKHATLPFEKEIDALSGEIRFIYGKYKSSESLPPDKEKAAYQQIKQSVTNRDRDRLEKLNLQLDDKLDAMRRKVGTSLKQAISEDQNRFIDVLTNLGGTVISRTTSMNTVSAILPSDALEHVAGTDGVIAIEPNRKTEYELNISVPSCGYDDWWNIQYDGGAYDFGIVDSGVAEDHPAFSNVNFYSKPGSSVTADHGTHVTGIVASADATYKGGAYGLDAVIWANSGPGQSGTMENMDWLATSATQGPEVINHSLGYGVANDTDYSNSDAFYDSFVKQFSIMVTKSTGNSGWNDNAPTITHPAPAYNLMAVANMDDLNTLSRSDDVRRSSSSVGPTLNSRKKPDICAPGSNIISTNADHDDENDFISKSGTSMAAPHVAAAVVLMEEAGNHTPMAQKAVLINTADAWDSNNTLTTADDDSVVGSYWDKSYGWGYLDMDEAEFNRADYFTDSIIARNDTATDDDYKLYKGTMYKSTTTAEKATLVWQKRSNYVSGEPPSTTYALSDLNLRLYNETNGALLDSDMDGNDNVHQVDIAAGANGWNPVVIKAYAWSSTFAGATSEAYALATEENFTEATPPSFQRNYSRPNYVGPYQTFDVTVRIFNNGDVSAHTNTVTLANITGATINGANNQALPTILPGPYPNNPQATIYSITTSGIAAGTHWLPIDFKSECYLENYAYATAYGVSIIVETTPPSSGCTSAAQSVSPNIPVAWTASDTQTGVKRSYLYAKPPGAASFSYSGLWATGTSGSLSYTATAHGTYHFAIRSVDNGGNWEPVPTASESTTVYTY